MRKLLNAAALAATISLCSIATVCAQTFTPGEIVQANAYGEKVEVKVVKMDNYGGVECLLKDWQDGTFKPGGSTRTFRANELVKLGAGGGGAAAGGGPAYGGGGGAYGAATAGGGAYGGGGYGGGAAGGQQAQGGASADLGGTGPLSKQQIIGYLKANAGRQGSQAASAAVVAAIKKRGVNFKANWQDLPEFMQAGGDMTVRYAIGDNYGAPVNQQWLLGPWELQFTNATGFFASRDSAAKMGFVSIEPAHTYIWKIHQDDPPNLWIDGKWREATPEEMKYQGGAGIVLLNGEQHYDWIVHKDQTAESGEWINVADIQTRQVIRSGVRKLH